MRTKKWFGVLSIAVPFAFVACGDDSEDGGGNTKGGASGTGGATGGTATGGKGTGTGGATGGKSGATGGKSGASGTGGASGTNTGGSAGAGMGGEGGEAGGMGGEGGEAGTAQGGTAGNGGGAGGATAGGGAGGAIAGGGAGGSVAGGGAGGATAGGGAGGATAGGGGKGGTGPACDPTAAPEVFVGEFSGAAEVPANASTGTGVAIAELSPGETQLTVSVYWSGLTTNTTIGHIHGPAAAGVGGAGVLFDLMPPAGATSGEVVGKQFAISATQVADLKNSLYYANIHSTMFGAGELRAQLVPATVLRTGTLSGAQENPSNASTGTGRAVVAVFPSGNQAAVSVTWSGLTTNTTIGHIHGPAPAGMNAGVLFDLMPPAGATSGSVLHKIWTFTGGQSGNLNANVTYANIHSTMFMAGEIRAQLLPPCP